MAIIGETLAVPEYGFTRYEFINKDDLTLNNEYFYSIRTFITQDTNGLLAVGASNGGEILVKIKNTYNFRLLVCLPSSTNANTLYTNNMVVEIDGVKHTFDLTSNRNTTIIDNCLAVDIKNLSTNSHIVKIYADGNNNDTQMINVQAIDIDVRGVIGFTRTMASMFEGCANLKKDMIIPKNADIVENMFKNCTSMTHVHSNWDETYDDSGIITEGCYGGCTSITHIDDVALNLNEYTNGLDNIPSEWGGYGFTSEYSGIYMIEILSPNYTFNFASDGLLDGKYINWGDGTITQNEYSHTYVNAGVYIIKGQVHSPAQTATDSMKLCLKEIIQYPIYGNLYYAFADCSTLVSANISGNKYCDVTNGRMSVFQGCTNLERVIALDTKLEVEVNHISAFQGCKKLREIIGIEDFIYNTNNIMSSFNGCSSLPNFTLSEDTLKNCISFMLAFCGCTSLTESPIKTLVSDKSSLDISRMFEGCTNLTDISDVIFGENITSADGWYPPNLTTANNVIIKNDVVSFEGCTTLKYCNNLRSYYAKSFRNCVALVELKNLLIKSEDGAVINAYGAHAYRSCSKLKIIKFDPNCKLKYISCDFMFNDDPLLEEVDFGGGVTLEPTQNGDYTFNSTAIKTIKNMKVGGTSTTARFSGYSTDDYGNNFTNLEYLDCTIMTQKASKFFKGSGIKDVSNIKFDISVENLSESFMNNRLLLRDVEVQSHIRNCSSMFRNCTALTHIRSNWNNSYTGGITATGCYSGCTAITHVDDDNVIAYKGDIGLDYVPVEWGGNGLVDDGTISILEVTIPSDNYALKLFHHNYGFSRRGIPDRTYWDSISFNNCINWGDGESYKNNNSDGAGAFPTHTYARAGVYYIKGHFGRFGSGMSPTIATYDFVADARPLITKVLKWAYLGHNDVTNEYKETNLGYSFTGLSNVKSISGLKVTNKTTDLSGLFQNCASLISIDFNGCDTSNVTSMQYMFDGCSSLTYLDLSSLNMSKIVNMGGMFCNCKSFTEAPIKNFPSSVWNVGDIFKGCSSLTHDITIPSHIRNCSNMFKDCTSMTHIRSNWNNSYTNEIISTGCYSGCTAISHIDDKNVIAYEGDVGLDYLPIEWGGNGFDKSNTTVLRINLTSNNYNVCICAVSQPNGVTSWGDGTSDSSMAHTYSTAGTYILKTQKMVSTASSNATIRQVLTDVLALSSYHLGANGEHQFRECAKLKTVNMDDYVLKSGKGSESLFYQSMNIEYISAKNLTIRNNGFGCAPINMIDSRGNNVLTEIVGVDTWKIETDDLSYLFAGYYKLESLDISNWNLENVTNMSNMFDCCRSLTESPIKNFPSSVSNISDIFKGCISLENLNFDGYTLIANPQLGDCAKLTVTSLLSVINALKNNRGSTTLTCTIGAINLAKLTSTQIKIATDKNWTLV